MTEHERKLIENDHLAAKYAQKYAKKLRGKTLEIKGQKLTNELYNIFLALLFEAIKKHDSSKSKLETYFIGYVRNWFKDAMKKINANSSSNGKLASGFVDWEDFAEGFGYGKEAFILNINSQREKYEYKDIPKLEFNTLFVCNGDISKHRLVGVMNKHGGHYTQKKVENEFYFFTLGSPMIDNINGITMFALEYEPWELVSSKISQGDFVSKNGGCYNYLLKAYNSKAYERVRKYMSRSGQNHVSFSTKRYKYILTKEIPLIENIDGLHLFSLRQQDWNKVHHVYSASLTPF